MDIMKIFRWRSRVKTSSPSIAGSSIETLASHTADINAHPDYLKKGSAVPTGQEAQAIARHEINPICHADEYFRRGEGLRTREQYHAAKDTDYVPRRDKYMLGTPMPHLVTAYVLNMVLDQYITEFDIREMVKHPYMNAVGDGSQLIWIKTDGYAVLSDKTIGSSINPVYLKDGVITVSSETIGGLRKPVWLNEGTITAFTGTTGNTVTPVYISDGVFTVCSELAPRMCPNLQRKSPEAYTVNDVPTSTTPIKAKDPDTMIATKKYVDDMGEEVKVKGTVGSTCIPIWLDDGTFKTLEGPIGNGKQPIYMTADNELMPMTDTIGQEDATNKLFKPVYVLDGEFTAASISIGLQNTTDKTFCPVFMDNGSIKAASVSIGSSKKPIYMTAGNLTEFKDTIGAQDETNKTFKPIYMLNGEFADASVTIGSTTKPIYMENGTLKASTSNIGNASKPIYMSSGSLTESNADVGSDTRPVYMNKGTLTPASPIPVNGCYISTVNTDPATTLGYGTWKMIAEIGSLGFIFARTA